MSNRAHLAFPIAAGLLTCLTIGLTIRLSARSAARQPLIAHAGAPRAALLPLSRLPASATDAKRCSAWGEECSFKMMMNVQADINSHHTLQAQADVDRCPAFHAFPFSGDFSMHCTLLPTQLLRYGDLTHTEEWCYMLQEKRDEPLFKYPHDEAHRKMTYSVSYPVGGEHRIRITWTRTATGLHTVTTSLPDLPAAP